MALRTFVRSFCTVHIVTVTLVSARAPKCIVSLTNSDTLEFMHQSVVPNNSMNIELFGTTLFHSIVL